MPRDDGQLLRRALTAYRRPPSSCVIERSQHGAAPAASRWWSQQAELTASNAAELAAFGLAVAISGKTALVGAPQKAPSQGRGVRLRALRRAWSQQPTVTTCDGTR